MNNQAVKAAQEAVQRSEELDIRFGISGSAHASPGPFPFDCGWGLCGIKV
jgi:hypothetical protein